MAEEQQKDPVKEPAKDVQKDPVKAIDPDLTKLVAPDGAGSVTFAGKEYPVEDGAVSVPHAAVAHLHAHGYHRPKTKKGA
jgi:hypothetical protein